ncbi:MAG: M28 family metallopeptidase, partial [Candidatus Bathyarchaeia archaeon]
GHVRALSALPSRVTGYPGAEAASTYMEETLKSYGLSTRTESYFVTTPLDMGANITLLSPDGTPIRVLQAYAMWPNVVNPSPYNSPPEGDTMIYGGYADFSDFADYAQRFNVKVEGKVVLVEFNSRWYWKNAALLGAKAVIFIAPDETFRPQAEQKTMSIPVNFPRLYVSREDGLMLRDLLLREGSIQVSVSSFMKWVRKPTVNVIATLEGEDPSLKREIVAVTAYYDSWSPVPALAPGATDALNPAFLLEFARVITQTPDLAKPKRSVMFIAFSGHYQGIWGAREFIDAHFAEIGTKIKLFLSLDLATESKQVALYHTGTTYPYSNPAALQAKYYWARDAVLTRYKPAMEQALDRTYETLDGIIVVKPPYEMPPLMFESDAFTLTCYGGGLAFRTTNAIRPWQKTPLDTPDRLRMENLWPQVEFITGVYYAFLNDPSISTLLSLMPGKLATDWGFATVTGQISLYNATSAWFDPVVAKDAVVRVVQMSSALAVPGVMTQAIPTFAATASGVGFASPYPGAPLSAIDIVMLPDENGVVKFKGVKPFTSGLMMAYVINST